MQVDDLTAPSQEVHATPASKPITIDQYQTQDDATAAVVSGKDDAMLADSPVVAYAVKQTNGQLALVGDIYDSAPYGYVRGQGPDRLRERHQGRRAGADRRRHLQEDPEQRGASRPARSPTGRGQPAGLLTMSDTQAHDRTGTA